MEAETGVMQLYAKERQELLATPEASREASNRFSLGALRRDQPCCLLDFGLLASRTMRG